jgi:hypothetical protein
VAGSEPATLLATTGTKIYLTSGNQPLVASCHFKFRDGRAVLLGYEPAIPALGCMDGLTHLPGS